MNLVTLKIIKINWNWPSSSAPSHVQSEPLSQFGCGSLRLRRIFFLPIRETTKKKNERVFLKIYKWGTSLVVQWLRLGASTAGGTGSILIGELHTTQPKNKNKTNYIYVYTHTHMLLQLYLTLGNPWTVACLAPLSTGFSKQEYWSGLPCPPPGDLPHPGIESVSLASPTLAGEFFATSTTWESLYTYRTPTKVWCSKKWPEQAAFIPFRQRKNKLVKNWQDKGAWTWGHKLLKK